MRRRDHRLCSCGFYHSRQWRGVSWGCRRFATRASWWGAARRKWRWVKVHGMCRTSARTDARARSVRRVPMILGYPSLATATRVRWHVMLFQLRLSWRVMMTSRRCLSRWWWREPLGMRFRRSGAVHMARACYSFANTSRSQFQIDRSESDPRRIGLSGGTLGFQPAPGP